ncbi:MAG: hypothetical protein GY804_00015 [Alphaproteobacteria bacterium]|nr:hypothetical protein [Alphaproteobacteria bacterium]
MKKIKTEEIQTTLKVLMKVNSDEKMLEKFKEINGLHLAQNAQVSIAECFRFLVALRDSKA